MSYYSLLDVTPKTRHWMKDYEEVTNPLVREYGGEYIAKTTNHERLEGKNEGYTPTIRIIIKWPSKVAALGFMNDPRYAPHLAARTKESISNHFLVEGTFDHKF